MRNRLSSHRRGQGLTEYILIVALVAIASIGVVAQFGDNIRAVFGMATDAIAGHSTETTRAKTSNQALEHRTMGDFGKSNN